MLEAFLGFQVIRVRGTFESLRSIFDSSESPQSCIFITEYISILTQLCSECDVKDQASLK